MRSRFAAVRVRPAHRDDWRSTPRPEEWLLIEWPRAEAAPINGLSFTDERYGRGVTWRQGTRGAMRSRFAAVRVRPAHRDDWRSTPRPEEWLLIEWPRAEAAPINGLSFTDER